MDPAVTKRNGTKQLCDSASEMSQLHWMQKTFILTGGKAGCFPDPMSTFCDVNRGQSSQHKENGQTPSKGVLIGCLRSLAETWTGMEMDVKWSFQTTQCVSAQKKRPGSKWLHALTPFILAHLGSAEGRLFAGTYGPLTLSLLNWTDVLGSSAQRWWGFLMSASFPSRTSPQPLAKFQMSTKRPRWVITISIIIERTLLALKWYSCISILFGSERIPYPIYCSFWEFLVIPFLSKLS